jgi:hypothetical protein
MHANEPNRASGIVGIYLNEMQSPVQAPVRLIPSSAELICMQAQAVLAKHVEPLNDLSEH